MIEVKRVYDESASTDGTRVLVDRLWPRGVAKADADFEWEKVVAPSDALRMWYAHIPERFEEFSRRYRGELTDAERTAALERLSGIARKGTLTLLTATKDPEHSQAAVLQQVIAERV
ncbi:DUF488 family protein [Actinocatenispora sera]|uniref:DUF488 family protein n=1 Tax=Actinocatenispora sera TaxID=390989 RepID=A0A810L5Z4_9ACTN|nr:DUF488 family protein [Actinocatenispora sera]BCJ29751.1 hypothetical protein Asera_38590 [Actinocatenispora sera]